MKRNKKGFTLVELLAVIVVLAIIMIIAVPSVMESMNNARKQSFVIYAQKVMTTAQTKVQANILTGSSIASCYTLNALMGESTGNYKGYVTITNPNTDTPVYKIYLKDNNYSFSNKDASGLNTTGSNIGAGSVSMSYPKNCCKNMACSEKYSAATAF